MCMYTRFWEPTLPERWSRGPIWRHGQYKMAAHSVEFWPSLERHFSGIGCTLEAKSKSVTQLSVIVLLAISKNTPFLEWPSPLMMTNNSKLKGRFWCSIETDLKQFNMWHNPKWSQSSFNRQLKHWTKLYFETGLGYPRCCLWENFKHSEFKQMVLNEVQLCRIPKYTKLSVLSYTISLSSSLLDVWWWLQTKMFGCSRKT